MRKHQQTGGAGRAAHACWYLCLCFATYSSSYSLTAFTMLSLASCGPRISSTRTCTARAAVSFIVMWNCASGQRCQTRWRQAQVCTCTMVACAGCTRPLQPSHEPEDAFSQSLVLLITAAAVGARASLFSFFL
jgi:SNF family Na+-dependent transporter